MAHSKSGGTDKRGLEARARAIQARDLRKAGAPFAQIGAQMGYSEQRAHQVITKALSNLNLECVEAATEVTRLELERLDSLWLSAWQAVKGGDMQTINACIRIMDRRAKLLGLDAPAKQELTGPEGGPIEVSDTRQRLKELIDRQRTNANERSD